MAAKSPQEVILATDCGSTTTKAIVIVRDGGGYRLLARGEAPTTVEAPFEDVTAGVLNATGEVEEITGLRLTGAGRVAVPRQGEVGCDAYVSTSSAGGGLQMMVAGVIRAMTAESAERAALGAGAIVMDVIAVDDGREEHERIQRIRNLRPDMILLSGGTDGGTTTHVLEMTELLLAADPQPRLGGGYRIPVIYAGNKDAREEVKKMIADRTALQIVENIRPTLEEERLGEARGAVHDLFLEHVMQHAPGYPKLMSWTSADIRPTPEAVGLMVETVAREQELNVLAVDIGGATTDVFSVFGGIFNRTVSANLGLSYSVCNVLREAGAENVLRWLPYSLGEDEMRERLYNKMVRPTTIPQTKEDLLLEQAVAREALRGALAHHKQLAVGLKGIRMERTISAGLRPEESGETLVNMLECALIIGSGGVLSHAPKRAQAALMLVDAFEPEGVTALAVDSIFMMPQLGVLSQVNREAAMTVFERDCLIWLGTCISPVGSLRAGQVALRLSVPALGLEREVRTGELLLFPLAEDSRLVVEPARGVDVGAGPGRRLERGVRGGVVGLIVDARGRPLTHESDAARRQALLRQRYAPFEAVLEEGGPG